MKNVKIWVACFSFLLGVTVLARDPFVKVGQEEGGVTVKTNNEVLRSNETAKVTEKELPVAKDEWKEARDALRVNSFVFSGDTYYIQINGRKYLPGNVLTVTNKGVQFAWRLAVNELQNKKSLELQEEKATRITIIPSHAQPAGILQ